MDIWGVGGRFAIYSVLYAAAMLVAHYLAYPLFRVDIVPYPILMAIGGLLLAVGVPLWIWAAVTISKGFSDGRLVTGGVYALCRNPLYGNATFYALPGVILFFRSWLLLTLPVFMYIVFKRLIVREDAYLHQTFGPAYERYTAEVNEVFPKLWKLPAALENRKD